MKKFIIILFCYSLNAGLLEMFTGSENPNGEPWLLTIKYGKLNSGKFQNNSSPIATRNIDFVLPMNEIFTLKESKVSFKTNFHSNMGYEHNLTHWP